MKCFPDVKCLNKNDFNDANACARIAMYGHVYSYLRDVFSRQLGVSHMHGRHFYLLDFLFHFTADSFLIM